MSEKITDEWIELTDNEIRSIGAERYMQTVSHKLPILAIAGVAILFVMAMFDVPIIFTAPYATVAVVFVVVVWFGGIRKSRKYANKFLDNYNGLYDEDKPVDKFPIIFPKYIPGLTNSQLDNEIKSRK